MCTFCHTGLKSGLSCIYSLYRRHLMKITALSALYSQKTHYIITVALNQKLRHCCSRLQFLVKPGWCLLFYSHLNRYKQPQCNLSLSLFTTTDGNCFLGNCLGEGLLISHCAETAEDGAEGEEVTFIAEQEGKVGTQENHQVSEWQKSH